MSVTFWVPDAPMITENIPCEACDGSGFDPCDEDGKCPYCLGVGRDSVQRSLLPEVNLCQSNAYAFLKELGYADPELCGTWSVLELPTVETKLHLILMGTGVALELEPNREANVFLGGRDAEYIERRAKDLLSVVQAARKAQLPVSWG